MSTRRKVHPRRTPDGKAPARGDRRALHARLVEAYGGLREKWSGWETGGDAGCDRLLEQAQKLLKPPDVDGRLDLDQEVARSALLTLPAAEPFDETAEALIRYWATAEGPGFAVEALSRSWSFEWTAQPHGKRRRFLFRPRSALGYTDPDALGLWTALRVYLSDVENPAYQAAREAAAGARADAETRFGPPGLLLRCAIAYAFPAEGEWVDADTAELQVLLAQWHNHGSRHPWCLLASVSSPAKLEGLVELACTRFWAHGCDEFAWTLLDAMGAAAFPALARLADQVHGAGKRRLAGEAVASIESPEVADWFAARLGHPQLAGIAAGYLARLPALAVPALCRLPKHDDAALQLLTELALKHADVVEAARGGLDGEGRQALERALRRVQRKQAAAPAEEAPLEDAPRVLRDPGPRRKLPAFWDLELLPPLVLRDGRALPKAAVEALGGLLATSSLERPHAGLAAVREACTSESLAEFAWALFSRWLQAEAPAGEKWALFALAHVGGDEAARRLAPLLLEWPAQGKSARTTLGLEVLGAIGSDVALVHTKRVGEKTSSKALRKRVGALLEQAAGRRGLSLDELEDRMVPDLGLDAGGTRVLDFGSRAFRVGFDGQLKAFLTDAAGKRLTRLPPPGKSDDAAKAELAQREWKSLKADAEIVLAAQVKRLEAAMCARRTWKAAGFRALAEHPLLRHLLRRLLWEADGGGDSPTRFRIAEDGSFSGVGEEAFALPAAARVRLPHPLEIEAGEADAWRALFADYQIVEPFPQLSRPFHAIAPDERSAAALLRAAGHRASSNRLLGSRHRGWSGSWELAGALIRRVPGSPYSVTLEVSAEGALGKLQIFREEKDGLPVPARFGELDPIAFSEIVKDLEWLKG